MRIREFGFVLGGKLGGAMLLLALAAVCTLSSSTLLLAETDAAAASGTSRALRLSAVEGQVQVLQDGQVIADPAYNNLPLFEGSQIITGGDGRAEVQMEDGSLARLSPNTTLTFSIANQNGAGTRTELVLNAGLAYFELQPSTAEHQLSVNYGSASFTASSFSVVRINQDAAPGELAVFSGNVHLERGSAVQLDLRGGESLSLDVRDTSKYNLTESIEPDSWDSWNSDRDQLLTSQAAEKTVASGEFVNSQGSSVSDLDANGNWYNVPGQGYVWSPYEAASYGSGWDPYGFGRWVFYPRYGYVFVSGYSWGYAPYQCGLWNFYDGFGWGWAPGGGCSPWYGGGGGGWYSNIGRTPRGYHPPKRPIPMPGHPRSGGGADSPKRIAAPVVPVDRRKVGEPDMPIRGRTTQPVVIAGHVVEPLRPVAPRPIYDHPGTSIGNRDLPGAGEPRQNPVQPPVGGRVFSGTHPGYIPGSGAGTNHGSGSGGPRYTPPPSPRPSPPPAPRQQPSGGGGGYRPSAPSAPSAPHSSSGGSPHK